MDFAHSSRGHAAPQATIAVWSQAAAMASPLNVNLLDQCQQCGDCCRGPCGMLPADLPDLLGFLGMDLPSAFQRYLVLGIIGYPNAPVPLLELLPAKALPPRLVMAGCLPDESYARAGGHCVFLQNRQCGVYPVRPAGARYFRCSKVTGFQRIAMNKQMRAPFWAANQHLFDALVPGYGARWQRVWDAYRQAERNPPPPKRAGLTAPPPASPAVQAAAAVWTREVWPMLPRHPSKVTPQDPPATAAGASLLA